MKKERKIVFRRSSVSNPGIIITMTETEFKKIFPDTPYYLVHEYKGESVNLERIKIK